jgi:hypothetical protein
MRGMRRTADLSTFNEIERQIGHGPIRRHFWWEPSIPRPKITTTGASS